MNSNRKRQQVFFFIRFHETHPLSQRTGWKPEDERTKSREAGNEFTLLEWWALESDRQKEEAKSLKSTGGALNPATENGGSSTELSAVTLQAGIFPLFPFFFPFFFCCFVFNRGVKRREGTTERRKAI